MKKLVTIILCVMMLTFVACAGKNETNADNVNVAVLDKEAENVAADSNDMQTTDTQVTYPVTITDQMGREVVINSKPERIVSPYYITSSMLISLGLADRMAGIEDNPEKRNIYGLSAEYLLELPTVGTAKNLDLEMCAAIEADLVLLPMKLKDMSANLDELGITNMVVNPESVELLEEMITIVGKATDTVDKATELNNYINEQTKILNEKNKSVTPVTVYLSGNSDFLLTASDAMYQSSMIALAGGKNVAADIEDTYWAEVDYEQILAWNPEYIILASAAGYTVDDVMNDPSIAMCDAVKNGNVYQIPSELEAWDSPVPGAFLGSVWLESVLHPECMSETEYKAAVKEFYEKFYGVTGIE